MQVNKRFDTVQNVLLCKRLADGSKRIRLPQFLSAQVNFETWIFVDRTSIFSLYFMRLKLLQFTNSSFVISYTFGVISVAVV